ncbi:hypothetical protein DM02DRAFT_665810 [Periconia macrospinosa]|uniref:CFEM domain-containing protein n=1 Tax=Periconia macrospinosa TaxID=97972 RepID=A0A2V1EDQ3_9PLEO|nr:hypothetical protein DM02DRAFT_665810 [Periconia macrospinosa]
MKTFFAAALISLAGVATAQLDAIPQCALSCFLGPLSSDGCSELTDFKCHCGKFDTLVASVTPCVQKACSASDQAAVITGVENTCKAAGVTVTAPNLSSTAPPTSASSAAASSAASSVSSKVSSVASSASSAVSSAASSAASRISSSVANATSSTPTGSTPSASTTSGAAQFPGAAARFAPGVGIVGAALAAVFVL